MEHCTVTDCQSPAKTLGLCSKHYQRLKRTGSTERYGGRSSEVSCLHCGTPFRAQLNQIQRGEGKYCSYECKHKADTGVEKVTGTRYVRRDGYVTIKTGIRQTQLEHRLVIEQSIGRKLTTDEHVHHINGDRADNRRENLLLLTNAEHQKLHDHLGVQHAPRTVILVCVVCAKEYKTRPSRGSTSTCCSDACRLVHMRAGRKPTK